jgi:type IV pilus assembly protein PilV
MRIFQIRAQSGSTLIEIMVAIVVMAIGLLGLAGLQVNALKFQKSASQRSEASQAASDLADRIRANWSLRVIDPEVNIDYYAQDTATNLANYTFNANYTTSAAATHIPPNICSVSCNATQIAANDIQIWLRDLQRRLVGGSGYVVPVANTSISTFDITIMWREQGLAVADPACPAGVAAPVDVRCFVFRTSP